LASPTYENVLRHTLLNYETLDRPPLATEAPSSGQPGGGIGAASTSPQLKIGVTQDGMYELSYTDLTDHGFSLSGVSLSTIKIKNRGTEIPIYVYDNDGDDEFDSNDYILFYGTAITDIYTTKNIYWLEAGGLPGLRMSARDGTPGSAILADHFPTTLHAEEDTFYWQGMPNGQGQDHWFWEGLLTAPGSRPYAVTLNNISTTATNATVRVQLKGRRDWDWNDPYPDNDHRSRVHLNQNLIDDQQWDGYAVFEHAVDVSHSFLIEGSNVITVETLKLGPEYNPEQILINWIEIDYWDTYVAENDQLLFGAPAGTYRFEVTNFSSDQVQLFDVTDPAGVEMMTGTAVTGGELEFEDTALASSRYLALTADAYESPASIVLDQPSNWKNSSKGADYIIITHADFYTKTQPLAAYRETVAGGDFRVATVKIEDIYDEFNDGIFNPQAIQDFLKHTFKEWVDPDPTYVLLVGGASQDYRDLLSYGRHDYVPTQMIETEWGQAASDNWFVLLSDPPDILPDMFIGRLTPQTVSDAQDMVTKIMYYEQNPPPDPWNKRMLLVADDGNSGDGYSTSFETTSNQLAGKLPFYYTANKVYVRSYAAPANPTTDIINYIDNGTLLVNYSGHGSVDTWGHWSSPSQRIFNRDPDILWGINNINKLPVVTIADCLNGDFTGDEISIAEEFLRRSNKGAVAVWAETGLGYPYEHRLLLNAFYDLIFQEDVYNLGAVTTEAKYAVGPSWDDMIETFVLFGDPAMQLGLPENYPYVESTNPVNGATGVPIDQDIEIVFSKPMNPATVNLTGVTGLSPSWNSDGTVATYSHSDFAYGETLTLTVTGQDNMGNSLGSGPVPTPWSFKTISRAPEGLEVVGPTTGITQTTYVFMANVSADATVLPLTYEWQATGQSVQIREIFALSDTLGFSWSMTGSKTIVVTATNEYGAVSATHIVEISNAGREVFLPIIIKNQ
jgi:hypothetical protein